MPVFLSFGAKCFLKRFEHKYVYQYVPHKAVAEVSKIANSRRLVAVNHGSQSEPADGPTSGSRQRSVDCSCNCS